MTKYSHSSTMANNVKGMIVWTYRNLFYSLWFAQKYCTCNCRLFSLYQSILIKLFSYNHDFFNELNNCKTFIIEVVFYESFMENHNVINLEKWYGIIYLTIYIYSPNRYKKTMCDVKTICGLIYFYSQCRHPYKQRVDDFRHSEP